MLALNINIVMIALALIIIVSFWIFVFIIFYHLVRFGVGTLPKTFSALFILGSLILFSTCIFFFSTVDFNNINRLTIQSINNTLKTP